MDLRRMCHGSASRAARWIALAFILLAQIRSTALNNSGVTAS